MPWNIITGTYMNIVELEELALKAGGAVIGIIIFAWTRYIILGKK